jgi:hypothetical protein
VKDPPGRSGDGIIRAVLSLLESITLPESVHVKQEE